MQSLDLPAEDWESIQNLALGTSVLQLGFCDGTDTILLAQTASLVVATGQASDALCVHSSDRFWSWDRTVHDAGKGERVLGSSLPWLQVCAIWPAKAFGLAVVNPFALDEPDPVRALVTAGHLADRVVVIDDTAGSCAPPVFMVFESDYTMITLSGRLLVVQPSPDASGAAGGEV